MEASVFKSDSIRDNFRACYHKVLIQFPFEQLYVDTSVGKTFMLTTGDASNPPVILLHGSCSNSAFWFPEIMALSQEFKIYAVDIIGEAGNSCDVRPDLESDAFAVWLSEVLDALNLEKATLIGNSLGGWMALKFASTCPDRVDRLILIASGGLAEVRPQFIDKADQARNQEDTLSVDPTILGQQEIPQEVIDFMNLIIASYNPIQTLPVFTDEHLRQLSMPVLFIAGEEDQIIDADLSAQRLSNAAPAAEIRLLKGCGHYVANALDYILPFLR